MKTLLLALFMQGAPVEKQLPEAPKVEAVVTAPAPKLTELELSKVQVAVMKKNVLEANFNTAKAEFEKNISAMKADYAKLDQELQQLLLQLFAVHKMDVKDFQLNPQTGLFEKIPPPAETKK